MMVETLRVIAQAVAKPGCIQAIGHLVKPLAETTRLEPGCLRYELWLSSDHDDGFVIFQEWESAEALEKHIQSETVEELGYRLGELVLGPPIVRRYRVAV